MEWSWTKFKFNNNSKTKKKKDSRISAATTVTTAKTAPPLTTIGHILQNINKSTQPTFVYRKLLFNKNRKHKTKSSESNKTHIENVNIVVFEMLLRNAICVSFELILTSFFSLIFYPLFLFYFFCFFFVEPLYAICDRTMSTSIRVCLTTCK